MCLRVPSIVETRCLLPRPHAQVFLLESVELGVCMSPRSRTPPIPPGAANTTPFSSLDFLQACLLQGRLPGFCNRAQRRGIWLQRRDQAPSTRGWQRK